MIFHRSTRRFPPSAPWAALIVFSLALSACATSTPDPNSQNPPAQPGGDEAGAEPEVGTAPTQPPASEPDAGDQPPYPAAEQPGAASGDTSQQLVGEPYPAPLSGPNNLDEVMIDAGDGTTIVGTFYAPDGVPGPWPGVILIHMLGSDRGVYEPIAPRLAQAGYAALAIDLRGHGETAGAIDWALAADDLARVWDFLAGLPNVDPSRTAVIGASIGGNLALITGANQPQVKTVVLLSPGLDYQGVTTEDAIATYGARPLLIVASSEDSYAASSSETLDGLAQGEHKLELYTGAGHGTNMFFAQQGLVDLILTWLEQHL